MTLKEKTEGYHRACGFETRTLSKYPHVIEARRIGIAGSTELTVLWVEEEMPEKPNASTEARTLALLGELQSLYPRATCFFICPTTAGLSQEFRKLAKALGFNLREEVLFFDAEFRSDVNREASDVSTTDRTHFFEPLKS
jgi:hypothetical protein